jgi:hypothetical protein
LTSGVICSAAQVHSSAWVARRCSRGMPSVSASERWQAGTSFWHSSRSSPITLSASWLALLSRPSVSTSPRLSAMYLVEATGLTVTIAQPLPSSRVTHSRAKAASCRGRKVVELMGFPARFLEYRAGSRG